MKLLRGAVIGLALVFFSGLSSDNLYYVKSAFIKARESGLEKFLQAKEPPGS